MPGGEGVGVASTICTMSKARHRRAHTTIAARMANAIEGYGGGLRNRVNTVGDVFRVYGANRVGDVYRVYGVNRVGKD